MQLKMQASLKNPPVGALVTAECVKQKVSLSVDWTEAITRLIVNEEVSFTTSATISRYLARLTPDVGLYGSTALERTEVDHWVTFSLGPLTSAQGFDAALDELNAALQRSTYLVGGDVTLADTSVFGALFGSGRWSSLFEANRAPASVNRWYRLLSARDDFGAAVNAVPEAAVKQMRSTDDEATVTSSSAVTQRQQAATGSGAAKNYSASSKRDEGKFVELPGAEKGKVVVRFPPEASGYLHIGHAKAALLNQYYQLAFDGKLILRFDDTNPAKETAEFEQVITEDVNMLSIKPDIFSHTSDHFALLLSKCEALLQAGKAYCDDTEPEQMKSERDLKLDSKNRNNSVEMNFRMWNEMLEASEYGQRCCVRAKIDMQSANGCLRDPTIYRCKAEPHLRTGQKYRVYPTYDFACPIVDSVEGVTHALRTTEYNDRDDQYYWFIEQLELRKPFIWAYSRLNMTHTVLSKRKLAWFVEEGLVHGWDDPRFPTVRGILRRGMTVEGLKQFILAQGSSRSVVTMEWDKIWAFNKKVIDPIAPRYTALDTDNTVTVVVHGASEQETEVPLHPKNESVGTKKMWMASKVLIDERDARTLGQGQNATFINWGNLLIDNIEWNPVHGKVISVIAKTNLDDKDYKKTPKLTWLADIKRPDTFDDRLIPCVAVYFENIIGKAVLDRDDDFKNYVDHVTKTKVEMLGEPALKNVQQGDIIQLQRKGFFICDSAYEPMSIYTSVVSPLILFYVPDGHVKSVSSTTTTASKKDDVHLESSSAADAAAAVEKPASMANAKLTGELDSLIVAQGDKVRQLKSDKAPKEVLTAQVKVLLDLKAQYKTATGGVDWQPATASAPSPKQSGDKIKPAESKKKDMESKKSAADESNATVAAELKARVEAQGEKVRALKTGGGSADDVNREVQQLLALKAQYKELTGEEATPRLAPTKKGSAKKSGGTAKTSQAPAAPVPVAAVPVVDKASSATTATSGPKKQTRLGLEATKENNLSDWYSQVITKAEMIEYYDVSGCYILRPWAFAIWEAITAFFDAGIKKLGVQNCYFPMFVSQSALQKEKTHIADFAPEVAWVTKSGDTDLAEPIAIRPTSETVMYPSFAKWIKSHRDLPLRINQWCSVVRWEFKHPQPFLRTREFLWQEGHSAFATRAEAEEEVYAILELYRRVYEELLAIPVIEGKKTEKEKFAGGDFTTTVEAYVSASGRGLQGATSHHLGQNFSKMFEIVFEDAETNEKTYAHQNSWGLSTRSIGAMVMVHADNSGLVLPPRVASMQAVVVPCGITVQTTDDERRALIDKCRAHEAALQAAGVRCHLDHRDNYSPGWKFNHWELKGVPIRIEVGPRDMKERQFMAVRRDTGEKQSIKEETAVADIVRLLELIHENMFNRAKKDLDEHLTISTDWTDLVSKLDRKCIIQAPFCGDVLCEENIKKDSAKEEAEGGAPLMGAKSLCVPLKQPLELKATDKCIHPQCQRKPIAYTLFGRSY